ncbi:uncharacterized protein LOC108740875 [Agrilus planipennis]|uniref:Uncharacterized protein LOC108740875 n=1 Tax=Agrilus planipennis TaxID=224129 RepID=A0A1W4X444_AGRPL|nr:uncharacterized protein LOC108740875 [Agrilus planipennis]
MCSLLCVPSQAVDVIMVQTRRKESSGSAPDNVPRHRTRSGNECKVIDTSTGSDTETDESQEEEEENNSWTTKSKRLLHYNAKSEPPLPRRPVRQLRNKFKEQRFSSRVLRSKEVRARITLDNRHIGRR